MNDTLIPLWLFDLWSLIDNVRTHKPGAIAWLFVCAAIASLMLVGQVLLLVRAEERESGQC